LHELSTDIFWLSYSEEKELLSDDDKNRLEKAGEEEIKLKEDSVVLINDLIANHSDSFCEKLNKVIVKYERVVFFLEKQNPDNYEYNADRNFSISMMQSLKELINSRFCDINLFWTYNIVDEYLKKYKISNV
ncbi:MAG: hypothetical protein HY958_08430, partial [Bacteroidia bacterium]|nr:hypothetical protein [Bacteroidia bacterium]